MQTHGGGRRQIEQGHQLMSEGRLEVPQDLVRLSVGIESIEDLIGDLERALATA